MRIGTRPGLHLDLSPYEVGGDWWSGYNIRWLAGVPETIGLWRVLPCVDGGGSPVARTAKTRAHGLGIVQASHSGSQTTAIFAARNAELVVAPITGLVGGYTVQTLDWMDVSPSGGAMVDNEDQGAVSQMLGIPVGRVRTSKADLGLVIGQSGGEKAWFWDLETTTPATELANVPPYYADLEVLYEGHLAAAGCQSTSCVVSPLIYRISERGDFQDWAITSNGTAAEWTIYHRDATHIVAVGQVSEGHLIWTDVGVSWARFDASGYPPYAIETLHIGSGLAARDAWVEIDRTVIWLGTDLDFWVWNGAGDPQPLYCPLRDALLRRVERTKLAYRIKAHRSAHGEAVFTLCVAGEDPDVQIVFSPRERAWSVWLLPRWAFSMGPHALGMLAMGVDGELYHHELVPSGSPDPYSTDMGGTYSEWLAGADLISRPWALSTGLISVPEQLHPEAMAAEGLGVRMPLVHRLPGGVTDPQVTVGMSGHRDGAVYPSLQTLDERTAGEAEFRHWRRVAGDGVQLRIAADTKAWTRFGTIDVKAIPSGER